MRATCAVALCAVLATSACSRKGAPIATITGAVLVGLGALSQAAHHKCSGDCGAFANVDSGAVILIGVGAPTLVIGGLSWLYHLGADDDPAPAPAVGSGSAR
jgi:hypothetical protein